MVPLAGVSDVLRTAISMDGKEPREGPSFVLWNRCWRVRLAEELSIRYVLEGSVQKSGDKVRISGRRQPSCDGMSRMMREYHVRICEGLGVKFPGPTRHEQTLWGHASNVRLTP